MRPATAWRRIKFSGVGNEPDPHKKRPDADTSGQSTLRIVRQFYHRHVTVGRRCDGRRFSVARGGWYNKKPGADTPGQSNVIRAQQTGSVTAGFQHNTGQRGTFHR
jgi:hypothetical protein